MFQGKEMSIVFRQAFFSKRILNFSWQTDQATLAPALILIPQKKIPKRLNNFVDKQEIT